jgi:FtsZ-interacting cell division protein ZipA
MYILGHELNIYLVMVIIAAIFVVTAILVMSSHMKTRKPVSGKKKSEMKNKKGSPALQETLDDDLVDKSSQSKVSEKPSQKLQDKIPNKPEGGPAVQVAAASGDPEKRKNDVSPSLGITTTAETKGETDKTVETKVQAGETDKTVEIKVQAVKAEEVEEIEEVEKTAEDDGLMNVFDDDIVEDSAVSGLATLLADVDLDTLNKLSEEMSQVLLKNGSKTKRR